MLSSFTNRFFLTAPPQDSGTGVRRAIPFLSPSSTEDPEGESTLLLTLGWVTAGLGAVAVGLFVGRELRQRYKFNRRTPYDFYSHSGDELQEMEFGVGV